MLYTHTIKVDLKINDNMHEFLVQVVSSILKNIVITEKLDDIEKSKLDVKRCTVKKGCQ